MHQPYYRDTTTGHMQLPWVRLHCLKDYYDLPARLEKYERLKMTFNLVPSLIEQIDLYVSRQASDRHLDLTTKPTVDLDRHEKAEIFGTFFQGYPKTMIDPYPDYRRLRKKLIDCNMDVELAVRMASTQEIRDLVIWSNLVWVDYLFRDRQPFKKLFAKGSRFTEEEKMELIDAQYNIMAETIPLYRSLMNSGKIEVSFTPYYHPILPLLCDTNVAREALPGIALPKNRFIYPEDAEKQVVLAIEMFQDKFGQALEGMWPSEGSISEQMAPILAKHGIKWMASDEQVLYGSIAKSGQSLENVSPHATYRYNTDHGPINIFFRDHALSDKIGFVYSGWDEDKAVNDFIDNLHRLADILRERGDDAVVPIILDGENCWEYYHNDGDRFLTLLFDRLEADKRIMTVTFNQAAKSTNAIPLKNLLAGSWINRNFRIWIGHQEDNTAWDLLWETRRSLSKFIEANPRFDPAKIAAAEKAILVAEGSDWNWWYGDEHRGSQNEIFDGIYRSHLSSVYSTLGLEVPKELLIPITTKLPETYLTEPEGPINPKIDGRLTHYYEWLGAGKYDCLKAGGAMHRVDHIMSQIYYAADDEHLYLRIDFTTERFLIDKAGSRLIVRILNPGQGEFVFSGTGIESLPDWAEPKNGILYGVDNIVEIGLKKKMFSPDGKGEVFFRVAITDKNEILEDWPLGDPIRFQFFGKGEEIIWDL